MELQELRTLRLVSATCLALLLAACGGGNSTPADTAPVGTLVEAAVQTKNPSVLAAGVPIAGVTPFIAFVTLYGTAAKSVTSVNFVIAAQPGTVSKPVSVTYSYDYLARRGYVAADLSSVTVPVFGLYAGKTNAVSLNLTFSDASTYQMPLSIATSAWTDPDQIYDRPTIVQARAAGSSLGFDFLYMKSDYGSPVVIDTDGQVRWVGPAVVDTLSTDFSDGGFILGSDATPDIYRLEFDGTYSTTGSLAASGVVAFNHDIEAGKTAFLNNVDIITNGVEEGDSTAQEFTPAGQVLATWDLGAILSATMTAGGDDPTLFVRPSADWFHMNTAIYDASDDSVIVSSRENFVIKLDYQTGNIRWIFGDPTKYWYTFPSLRAKALTFLGDGLLPLGQHSVTIANDGSLMLFNDGTSSTNQPVGAPVGQSRAWSSVSDYQIDETAMTATEAWDFDYGKSLSSSYCSSARQVTDGSILVDYAEAAGGTATHIVGLDPNRNVSFDIQYANTGCSTSWNAQPLALDAMSFD